MRAPADLCQLDRDGPANSTRIAAWPVLLGSPGGARTHAVLCGDCCLRSGVAYSVTRYPGVMFFIFFDDMLRYPQRAMSADPGQWIVWARAFLASLCIRPGEASALFERSRRHSFSMPTSGDQPPYYLSTNSSPMMGAPTALQYCDADRPLLPAAPEAVAYQDFADCVPSADSALPSPLTRAIEHRPRRHGSLPFPLSSSDATRHGALARRVSLPLPFEELIPTHATSSESISYRNLAMGVRPPADPRFSRLKDGDRVTRSRAAWPFSMPRRQSQSANLFSQRCRSIGGRSSRCCRSWTALGHRDEFDSSTANWLARLALLTPKLSLSSSASLRLRVKESTLTPQQPRLPPPSHSHRPVNPSMPDRRPALRTRRLLSTPAAKSSKSSPSNGYRRSVPLVGKQLRRGAAGVNSNRQPHCPCPEIREGTISRAYPLPSSCPATWRGSRVSCNSGRRSIT